MFLKCFSNSTFFKVVCISLTTNVLDITDARCNHEVFCLLFQLPHEQIGSHRKDFHEIWYWCIRRKFVTKIKVTLRYKINNRYFT